MKNKTKTGLHDDETRSLQIIYSSESLTDILDHHPLFCTSCFTCICHFIFVHQSCHCQASRKFKTDPREFYK